MSVGVNVLCKIDYSFLSTRQDHESPSRIFFGGYILKSDQPRVPLYIPKEE